MTVQELIDELETLNPDAEVRLAFQPSWPFEHSLGTVAEYNARESYEIVQGDYDGEGLAWWIMNTDADEDSDNAHGPYETRTDAEEALDELLQDEPEDGVVYLGEGAQLGYLPGAAKQALGW